MAVAAIASIKDAKQRVVFSSNLQLLTISSSNQP